MASWLKAAEDLFEVVDRRAKLVVNELADEQSSSSQSAIGHDSNRQGYQAKRTKQKKAGQRRLYMNDFSSKSDNVLEHTNIQTSQSDMEPDKEDRAPPIVANEVNRSGNSVGQSNNEQQHDIDREASIVGTSLSKTLTDDVVKTESEHVEAPTMGAHVEIIRSTSNENLANDNVLDVCEEQPSSPSSAKGAEVVSENHQVDTGSNIQAEDADVSMKVDQEASEPVVTLTPSRSKTQLKDDDVRVEPMVNQKKQQEHKVDISSMIESPMKGKDQLDEAQGLLKTTSSTGQSKEARLARVCAGLSSRLQEYKSENAQLEELLTAERELTKSYEAHINQLQQDLSASKLELTRVESNMIEALAAKNSEIETLVSSMDSLKKQSALSEGNLASLQANMESIMRNRELTETRMMQALREELASTERRAEEERAAHNATKMASMEREVELEHRAVETSTALARIQRIAEERTAKTTELEQKVALLEVECASLNQELQDMEARARRGQKKSVDEANQSIQMQAWQDEVERARRGQRDAESKLSYVEAEVQKTRVEMAAMKRDAEHYSRQEHMELEKRYRELTDLLYLKQTQLENMASEKAALEFQLDKEIKRLQEAQVEAERSRITRRAASTSWEEDAEMKSLEPLPLHHRHMAGASIQLQKAAKFLDSGAVRATRFLWRYPIARLLLLFYLVFVHLFLMYLLHRLQEQDDSFAAREVAESMGLANRTLA